MVCSLLLRSHSVVGLLATNTPVSGTGLCLYSMTGEGNSQGRLSCWSMRDSPRLRQRSLPWLYPSPSGLDWFPTGYLLAVVVAALGGQQCPLAKLLDLVIGSIVWHSVLEANRCAGQAKILRIGATTATTSRLLSVAYCVVEVDCLQQYSP